MTPRTFAKKMQEILDATDDPEHTHPEGDALMFELLRELGYGEGVGLLENSTRWYS